MYSVKNILDKNPIQISGFVVVVVNFLILMGWVSMTGTQVAGLNGVVVTGLGLFIANKTENKADLRHFLPPEPTDGQGEDLDLAA